MKVSSLMESGNGPPVHAAPPASPNVSFGKASAEMQLESGLKTQRHPMKLKVYK